MILYSPYRRWKRGVEYEYLSEFEAKIGTARKLVKGTHEELISAKTPENPPHCHVPLINNIVRNIRYEKKVLFVSYHWGTLRWSMRITAGSSYYWQWVNINMERTVHEKRVINVVFAFRKLCEKPFLNMWWCCVWICILWIRQSELHGVNRTL